MAIDKIITPDELNALAKHGEVVFQDQNLIVDGDIEYGIELNVINGALTVRGRVHDRAVISQQSSDPSHSVIVYGKFGDDAILNATGDVHVGAVGNGAIIRADFLPTSNIVVGNVINVDPAVGIVAQNPALLATGETGIGATLAAGRRITARDIKRSTQLYAGEDIYADNVGVNCTLKAQHFIKVTGLVGQGTVLKAPSYDAPNYTPPPTRQR